MPETKPSQEVAMQVDKILSASLWQMKVPIVPLGAGLPRPEQVAERAVVQTVTKAVETWLIYGQDGRAREMARGFGIPLAVA